MHRQIAKMAGTTLLLAGLVGLIAFGLSYAFRDAILVMASGQGPRMNRGGPLVLHLITGGIGGFVLAIIKPTIIDSAGLVIDVTIAIVSVALAFGISYGLCVSHANLPAGVSVSVSALPAVALGVVYCFKIWRDETW